MEFTLVRPIVIGAIAGLLSLVLIKKWARLVPQRHNEKDSQRLLSDHRAAILTANSLFICAIAIAIYLFKSGAFPRSSWAHFCLMFGTIILAPAAALILSVAGKGRGHAIEAVIAFAIAQRTPLFVLGLLFVIGIVLLAGAAGYLIGR
jgi:hypothetical protein